MWASCFTVAQAIGFAPWWVACSVIYGDEKEAKLSLECTINPGLQHTCLGCPFWSRGRKVDAVSLDRSRHILKSLSRDHILSPTSHASAFQGEAGQWEGALGLARLTEIEACLHEGIIR